MSLTLLALQTEDSHLGADPSALPGGEGQGKGFEAVTIGKTEFAQAAIFYGDAKPDNRGHIGLGDLGNTVNSQDNLVPEISFFDCQRCRRAAGNNQAGLFTRLLRRKVEQGFGCEGPGGKLLQEQVWLEGAIH